MKISSFMYIVKEGYLLAKIHFLSTAVKVVKHSFLLVSRNYSVEKGDSNSLSISVGMNEKINNPDGFPLRDKYWAISEYCNDMDHDRI